MTRERFEFVDDVLVGVDATPERVKAARSIVEDEFRKSANTVRVDKEQHELIVKSIDSLTDLIATAGMDFLLDAPIDGHTELGLAIELLRRMSRVIKKWK